MNLEQYTARFNSILDQKLPKVAVNFGDASAAINYSMQVGGKRIRPALVYALADSFSIDLKRVDDIAFAIECMHTYSLVHDDLPAMDDDDLRRGKPACHIQYDEATAILVGDALNTYAFEVLSSDDKYSKNRLKQIKILANCSGIYGMILGQDYDLYAENNIISLDELKEIHKLKTAKIIQACLLMPYVEVINYDEKVASKLIELSNFIGIYYQIQDDILDVTKTDEELGKPSNSDIENNKSTYVSLLGLKEARKQADIYREKINKQINYLDLKETPLDNIIQDIFKL